MGNGDGGVKDVLEPPREDGGMTRKEKLLVHVLFGVGALLVAAGFLLFRPAPEPEGRVLDGMVRGVGVVTNGPGSYQVRFLFHGLTNWVAATNVFGTAEEAASAARRGAGAGEGLKRGFLDGLRKGLGKDKE